MNADYRFDITCLIKIILKHKKLLLTLLVLSVLLSVVFSSTWFIEPKYKSQLVMFPSSSNSISQSLLAKQVNMKQDILQYGEDEQIDQMLQVLNSTRLRNKVVEKFDLLNHYGLQDEKYKYTKLYSEYDKNIRIKRTEYSAVSVTVYDVDPQMAADMANAIGSLYDSVSSEMQKERAIQAFKIVEGTYLRKVEEIEMMEDSLAVLRSLGVNDYETQSEMINQQMAIEISRNNQSGIRELKKQVELLAKYGTPYVSLRDQLLFDKEQLTVIKAKYDEAKVDAEQVLPQKFVVSDAFPAEKKSLPIRWLIVCISTFAVVASTILLLVLADGLKRIKNDID